MSELGPRELALLATLSQKGRRLFYAAEAEPFWGNAAQARKALARLHEKGWLERLDRGRYMIVPLEAGMERKWSEDSLAIGTFLAPEGAAAYWTAVRYWGWTGMPPLLLEQNDEWAVTRRYMSQMSLAQIYAGDDQADERPQLHPVAIPVH